MKKIAALMIVLLGGFLVSQSLAGTQAEMQAVLDGFDTRVTEMFEAERGNAFEREKIKGKLLFRGYSGKINAHAARLLYLGEETPENKEVATVLGMYPEFYEAYPEYIPEDDLNAILQDNALIYMEQHEAFTNGKIYYYYNKTTQGHEYYAEPGSGRHEMSISQSLDRNSFHWMAPQLMRLIDMYGPNGTALSEGEESRITQKTVDLCLQSIFPYAEENSQNKHREYESSKTWDVYESENHHAMSVATCWYFAKLAKDHPDYQNLAYAGTLTPAEHYEEWNQYNITYLRERAKKGMYIEINSAKYNSSALNGIYNYYDFGEPELKKAAGQFLDLYYTYFAQEQFDGIQGGGRSRIYFGQGMENVRVPGVNEVMWYFFGMGKVSETTGDGGVEVKNHDLNPALTSYRPPAIVADLVLDSAGRGTYEVKQFPRAQTSSFGSSNPNKIKSNVSGVQRYSYCAPSFIMGTPMVDARPIEEWAAISCQNRWQAVVFPADTASGAPSTRIVPIPRPLDENTANNTFWSVQSKGSLITQKLGPDYREGRVYDTKEMFVWMNREGLTLSKEDGTPYVDSGIPTDKYGNLVDADGNVIHKDGYRLISDDGYLMDENGDLVLSDGEPINVWPTHSLVIKNGQTEKDVKHEGQSGILFVEAPEAYAAIRVVGTGDNSNYTVIELDKLYGKNLFRSQPKGWAVAAEDEYASVILEVMSKAEAGTFAEFKALVQANTPAFIDGGTVLSYTSIYGDTLTLDTAVSNTAADLTQTPTINGQAVDYEPTDKVLESPFLNAKYNSGVVTISNEGYDDLVLDFNEPAVPVSFSPANNATEVWLNPSFVATFDGDIVAGSGTIALKKSDGSTVESFDVNSAAVSINGSQLSFAPSAYLEMNTTYYIEIPAGTVSNFDGSVFEDAESNKEWSFTTTNSYPAITEFLPGNGVENAPLNTPLMATFDVPVQAGSGTILLKKQSDNSIIEQFDVTDPDTVTFSGSSVLFSPSVELVPGTVYSIEIPAEAVRGQNGVFHEGDSWSFSVTDTNGLVVVNSASYVTSDSLGSTGFDFAANADMIVVAYSSYCNNTTIPVISYGGVPLTQAVLDGFGGKSFAGIWYLDLTTTDYVAGDAELKIDFGASSKATGLGIGVVSLSAGGASIELDKTQEVGDESKVNNLTLTTTQDGAFNMVSFYGYNSSETPSIDVKLTEIYARNNVAGKDFAAGYRLNVEAGDHKYSWAPKYSRGIAAASFVIRDNSFSKWAEQNNLGVHSGLDDDPDGDGVPNGIEAVFGSNPSEASSGLVALDVNGEQISFSHPQADPLPSDLELSYSWSIDLINWYDCNGVDGPDSGETVSVSSDVVGGTNTVTVTPSAELDCLYLRAKVQQK